MTQEQFERITDNCQPHNVFSSDWTQYRSGDFADSLLPEIMVKLDWLHGALCQIHWLEGSGKSLKFPYEFFMSEKRVEEFDMKNLREYFK